MKQPLFILEYFGNTDIYDYDRLVEMLKEVYENSAEEKPAIFTIKMVPPSRIELSATRERGGSRE